MNEDTPVRFVRGEAVRLYMERAGFSDLGLARAAYGDERAESQRKRIRMMRDRDLTVLGTRGMTADEEASALASAFGWTTIAMLASRVVYSLFDQAGPDARAITPGGGALSWRSEADANDAAFLVKESGLYAQRPEVFAVTEREMLVHGFGPYTNWFNEARPGFVSMDAVRWLLDLERLYRGQPTESERFLAFAAAYLGHLGWMLMRLRETFDEKVASADAPGRVEALGRLMIVARILGDVGEHYAGGAAPGLPTPTGDLMPARTDDPPPVTGLVARIVRGARRRDAR